jgi:hypothetical protein
MCICQDQIREAHGGPYTNPARYRVSVYGHVESRDIAAERVRLNDVLRTVIGMAGMEWVFQAGRSGVLVGPEFQG